MGRGRTLEKAKEQVPGEVPPDLAASALLTAELATHAGKLRDEWQARIRDRGLLRHLSPEDLAREADLVFRVWSDLFTRDRFEDALARVRWVAERNMLMGHSMEETLGAFLAMRDACRQHLIPLAHSNGRRMEFALPQFFEERAQRLMVCLAVACSDERERLVRRRMQALVEAGMLLTANQGLDAVLQRIADLARGILGARYAALGVLDKPGKLSRFVTSGMDDEVKARLTALPAGKGILGIALRQPLRLDDLTQDPRAAGFPPNHPVMRSFLGVPIVGHGQSYGNLYLTEKHDGEPFTEEDEALAATFAAQAAAAIGNARSMEQAGLLEEARRRERQHAELLQRVIAAQEEERKRVARELHDHTGQSLTSLLLSLRTLESAKSLEEARERAAEMRARAAETLDELHHLAFELRPSVLDDLGLVVALQRYAEDFARRTGIHLEVALDPLEGHRLHPAVEIALYRIVQEALTNVAKHAGAGTASVLLQSRGDSLLLIVEDDGKGFQVPEALNGKGRHFGLMGMHERVSLLDGKLTVESTPGAGTTVYVEVPLSSADAPPASA